MALIGEHAGVARRRATRAESKADTRSRLLTSAWRIFARDGYGAASLEEIAESAGFSKGALYGHFSNKAELFLALLDARIERRIGEIQTQLGGRALDETLKRIGDQWVALVRDEPEWSLLLYEFWAHAVRDPRLRERFAARYQAFRAQVTEIVEREVPHAPSGMGPAELATSVAAMAHGFAIERLLDPDTVPDDLFPAMLTFFFRGLQATRDAAQP